MTGVGHVFRRAALIDHVTILARRLRSCFGTMARPRRIPDYPYTGVQRYFLTICTQNRAEYFRTSGIVDAVVDQFLQTARDERFAIIVYLLMPDHIHLLVDGDSDDSDLTQFMKLSKQRTGYWFK